MWRSAEDYPGGQHALESYPEVSFDGDSISVRDGAHPENGTLTFTLDEWHAFIRGAQRGEFDR